MMTPEISEPFMGLVLGLVALIGVSFVRLLSYQKATLFLAVMVGWLLALGALASSGFFTSPHTFPPRMGLLLVPMLALLIWVSVGKGPKAFSERCPGRYLVWFQAFRILVEVTIFKLAQAALMPREMTFEGRNFDVISGVTALGIGFFAEKNSRLALRAVLGWNLVCAGILCVTVVTGVLSAPGPQRVLMTAVPNVAVVTFPFVYIPAFMVPLAFTLHILSIRKCLGELKRAG